MRQIEEESYAQTRCEEIDQGSLGKKTKHGWNRNGNEKLKRTT